MASERPERMLTVAEAAALVNYPESVIAAWMERGLPYIASGEGRSRPRMRDRRIRASVLWAWVEGLEIRKREAVAAGGRGVSADGLSAWRGRKGVS